MKTLTSILLFPLCLLGQVGINTTTPIATLDVEGNIRIAVLNEGSDVAARDSILVMDGNQIIHLVSSNQLFSNVEKTLVKGTVNSAGGIILSSGDNMIPFDAVEFDHKNEFDTVLNEFVASEPGVYRVTAQIKQDVVTDGDFGLSVYKVDITDTEILLTRERYINLSVDGTNISSPVRRVETLTFLEASEKIRFKANSAVGLTLSASPSDTLFTLEQVH